MVPSGSLPRARRKPRWTQRTVAVPRAVFAELGDATQVRPVTLLPPLARRLGPFSGAYATLARGGVVVAPRLTAEPAPGLTRAHPRSQPAACSSSMGRTGPC